MTLNKSSQKWSSAFILEVEKKSSEIEISQAFEKFQTKKFRFYSGFAFVIPSLALSNGLHIWSLQSNRWIESFILPTNDSSQGMIEPTEWPVKYNYIEIDNSCRFLVHIIYSNFPKMCGNSESRTRFVIYVFLAKSRPGEGPTEKLLIFFKTYQLKLN